MGAERRVRVPALLVLPFFALPWNLPLIFCSGEDETADENPESQEMLEEQLVRMLTREVMDLISKWHAGPGVVEEGFSGERTGHSPNSMKACLQQY